MSTHWDWISLSSDELIEQATVEAKRDPEFATRLHRALAEAAKLWVTQILTTPSQIADIVNYTQLATEHANFIKEGKTSLEIFTFMNEEMNFTEGRMPQWRLQAFPKMEGEWLARFHLFARALHEQKGTSYNQSANTPHTKEPALDQAKIDGYTQNLLFWENNMKKINALFWYDDTLKVFMTTETHRWEPAFLNSIPYLWEIADEDKKIQYLIDWINLDIRDAKWKPDWDKLTGFRDLDGGFHYLNGLYASASRVGNYVVRMWLSQNVSEALLRDPSYAYMCFMINNGTESITEFH